MVGKTKARTAEDKKRFEVMRSIGCVCCLVAGWPDRPCEIHHIIEGYRAGHQSTLGLCEWHHRGNADQFRTGAQMLSAFGPSLAHGSRPFTDMFGTEADLLQVQNRAIELFRADPWLDLGVPLGVASELVELWKGLKVSRDAP